MPNAYHPNGLGTGSVCTDAEASVVSDVHTAENRGGADVRYILRYIGWEPLRKEMTRHLRFGE